MRYLAPLLVAALSSCQHRLHDVTLVRDTFSPPAAYTIGDKKPYVRKWSDCHVYRHSCVETEKFVEWSGRAAIPGSSLAIQLSEGSRIENTTAHPQYYDLWIQVPGDLRVGQAYELRPAAHRRTISRTRRWGRESDDVSKYSLLEDGEITVAGMQGYDVPHLAHVRRSVAVLTVIEDANYQLRFTLKGTLPISGDNGDRAYCYNLIIDREFTATNKHN